MQLYGVPGSSALTQVSNRHRFATVRHMARWPLTCMYG